MGFYVKNTKSNEHAVWLKNDGGDVDVFIDGELAVTITDKGTLHRYVCSADLGLRLDGKGRIKDETQGQ